MTAIASPISNNLFSIFINFEHMCFVLQTITGFFTVRKQQESLRMELLTKLPTALGTGTNDDSGWWMKAVHMTSIQPGQEQLHQALSLGLRCMTARQIEASVLVSKRPQDSYIMICSGFVVHRKQHEPLSNLSLNFKSSASCTSPGRLCSVPLLHLTAFSQSCTESKTQHL